MQDDMHFTIILKYAIENQALMTTMLIAVQQLVKIFFTFIKFPIYLIFLKLNKKTLQTPNYLNKIRLLV